MQKLPARILTLSWATLILALGLNPGVAVADDSGPRPNLIDLGIKLDTLITTLPPVVNPTPAATAAAKSTSKPTLKAVAAPKLLTAARMFPPPPGETRFRRNEVVVEFRAGTPQANIALVLRRRRLNEAEAVDIGLLGNSARLWRIPDARNVAAVIRELGAEPSVAAVQPNYVYALEQNAAPTPAAVSPALPAQYALEKLHVSAAPAPPPPSPVRVAVIDTAIDESSPDLAGAIEARFDAIGGATPPRTLGHGTSIAGAIAAHGRLRGVDPNVLILSARAFDSEESGPVGTTFTILKAIDWAAHSKAQVVNMSFAGPPDPALHAILAAAYDKGIMLVGAAGNGGRKSAPLYPGADAYVLAVTATDADDKLYANANVGAYVAVAAPGVDVLLPAPEGSYDLQTGTSVAAALVSGVAALVLERGHALSPAALRKLLTSTARPLASAGHEAEFGSGLVDAQRALAEARPAAATQ
jgi:subtilisin family serine protease